MRNGFGHENVVLGRANQRMLSLVTGQPSVESCLRMRLQLCTVLRLSMGDVGNSVLSCALDLEPDLAFKCFQWMFLSFCTERNTAGDLQDFICLIYCLIFLSFSFIIPPKILEATLLTLIDKYTIDNCLLINSAASLTYRPEQGK